jgi:hypothetical protein
MLKNAEKADFMNTRAVRVCQKMRSVSVHGYEKPYLYGILRKTVHGMEYY